MKKHDDIKNTVKKNYGAIAAQGGSCCCGPARSCCGGPSAETASRELGYSAADLAAIPKDANLGLGCGNPAAFASLKKGETVLDLGSGAGIDCFIAAGKVGPAGKVIGVDMTPEMIERARRNAAEGGYRHVEFRLGDIERLPVDDETVDAVISNCVINLAPDKNNVFREMFRVLKHGGRIMVSDMVLLAPLPARVTASEEAYVACIAGAALKDEYLAGIRAAGFIDVAVAGEPPAGVAHAVGGAHDLRDIIASIRVSAVKP